MSEENIDLGKIGDTPPVSQPLPKPEQQQPSEKYASLSREELIDSVSNSDTIDWEIVSLPSRGWYYDWDNGNIEVRAFGLDVDKILANQRLAQSGQTINMVLSHCCRFPDGFQPKDLIVGDQIFLLYYLRGITHGNMYEFLVDCPNPDCGAPATHTFDMNELITTMKQPSVRKEPFKVNLPYLSKHTGQDFWVECRLLRVGDINKANQLEKAKKNMGSQRTARAGRTGRRPQAPQLQEQDGLGNSLESSLVSILGVTDTSKFQRFIANLHQADSAAMTEAIEAATPGIDPVITVDCPTCGKSFVAPLPITQEFFRPKVARGLRA